MGKVMSELLPFCAPDCPACARLTHPMDARANPVLVPSLKREVPRYTNENIRSGVLLAIVVTSFMALFVIGSYFFGGKLRPPVTAPALYSGYHGYNEGTVRFRDLTFGDGYAPGPTCDGTGIYCGYEECGVWVSGTTVLSHGGHR